MKNSILASAAFAITLGLPACSTAGLSPAEETAEAQNGAMTAALSDEVATLNEITRIYIDAAALYKQAASLPDEQNGIAPILSNLAKQRNAQRDELQARILELGGEPAERGEALGTGHRAFTALRTLVDNDSEVAVEEVLRGERYISDEIGEALTLTMTPDTASLLSALKADVDSQIAQLEAFDSAA